MAEMSMNVAIHGAFRRDLSRFTRALTAFTEGDAARAAQLDVAWKNFYYQLDRHHHGEHDIAWPALVQVGVSSELLEQLDAEHDQLASSLGAADAAMKTLAGAPTKGNADSALAAVTELTQVIESHMTHEEAELEPVFLAKHDDPVMKQMGRQFGKVSPTVGGQFFAWVTDGASDKEMAAITGEVPKPVLMIIGGIFGRGYRRNIAPVWK